MADQFPHGYALLISVDENQAPGLALPAAARDVAALHAVLAHPQRCAYLPEYIKTVCGPAATREGILDGLDWLKAHLAQDCEATAILYFSGHGWRDASQNPARYYLIPYDANLKRLRATALQASDFAAEIQDLHAPRLLVVLDCCHAAGMGVKDGDLAGSDFRGAALPAGIFDAQAAAGAKGVGTSLGQGAGRAVLSSSQGEQSSYLRRDGTMSIFAYHLIEALTGHAAVPGQLEVLVSDVIGHVRHCTPASARTDWEAEQQPDYRMQGNFPVSLLLGGQGLVKGAIPPDLLVELSQEIRVPKASKQSFTAGDIQMQGGNLNLAAGNIYQTNITYQASDPRLSAAEEQEKARRRYLEKLRRYCQTLPLAALGGDEGVDDEITLERVYIDLETTTPVEALDVWDLRPSRPYRAERGNNEASRLSALAAAARTERLVLLGDPGSGKSTFVRRLLSWQCAAGLDPTTTPPLGLSAALTPILIELRHLGARLAGIDLEEWAAGERTTRLLSAVRDQIAADLERLEVPGFTGGLQEALSDGTCLVVCDGMDEVPHHLQARLRAALLALAGRGRSLRLLVTCRVRSYTGEARLPNFHEYTLAPFDKPRIERFARAWYAAQFELGRVDALEAEKKGANLAAAAQGDELIELAENPMLLTSMAIIHQKEIGLPRERVRLYNLVVDVLSRRWQEHKAGRAGLSDGLADFLRADLRLRAAMEHVAYAAHAAAAGQDRAADLRRGEALTLLEAPEYLNSTALAAEFLAYVDQRAGLLVGRGGEGGRPELYSFPHRTFQEYLAGCYLVNQRDAIRRIAAHAAEGDTWRLALVLGAEDLLYNRRQLNGLLDLTYRLCPIQGINETVLQRLVAWAGELATLAGGAEIERDSAPDGGSSYLQRLRSQLVDALMGCISPPERAAAGRALGYLGDPRPEVLFCDRMQFCYIPDGQFYLGSEEGDEQYVLEKESPCHSLHLPPFWLGRFPVTQAQFMEFVSANGYRQAHYWPEAQAHKLWSTSGFKGGGDRDFRQKPDLYGEPFDLPNHPVVGVSWYEALAFTRWLQETWFAQGKLPAGWQVRLPSEAEWEKAARGGLQLPAHPVIGDPETRFGLQVINWQDNRRPMRRYPWGDSPDPERANYLASRIGTTSAVGCFIPGISPYGCLDMSGNVWEWTSNIRRMYPYQPDINREDISTNEARVVRGGAFDDESRDVRCSCRYRYVPDLIDRSFGFRVCISCSQE